MSLLMAVAAVPVVGCGGGNDEASAARSERWCELVLEGAERTAAAEGSTGGQPADEGSDANVADVEDDLREHGWPAELREAGAVIEQGAPFPEDESWDEYTQALDEMNAFIEAECGFDAETEAFLLEGGPPPE